MDVSDAQLQFFLSSMLLDFHSEYLNRRLMNISEDNPEINNAQLSCVLWVAQIVVLHLLL